MTNTNTTRPQWSPTQDQLLKTAIRRYGMQHWKKIATLFVPTKNPNECRARWFAWLDPTLKNKASWSKPEEKRLLFLGLLLVGKKVLLRKTSSFLAARSCPSEHDGQDLSGRNHCYHAHNSRKNHPHWLNHRMRRMRLGILLAAWKFLRRNPRQCFFRFLFLQKIIISAYDDDNNTNKTNNHHLHPYHPQNLGWDKKSLFSCFFPRSFHLCLRKKRQRTIGTSSSLSLSSPSIPTTTTTSPRAIRMNTSTTTNSFHKKILTSTRSMAFFLAPSDFFKKKKKKKIVCVEISPSKRFFPFSFF